MRATGLCVLILDGDERASLAVVRSLVRAGFRVHVTASRRWSLAGSARGASGHRLRHSPLDSPLEYVREIAGLADAIGARVVIPVTDASVEAVLGNVHVLPVGVRLPFAPYEVYREASDKVRVHELALASGIGISETAVVRSKEEGVPSDPALYPGFVKPHRSVVGHGRHQKTHVRYVADRDACAQAIDELPADAFPVLVQRRISGAGEGVFLARWGGRTIARFSHRRLREKPPAGGVSVFREGIVCDPVVLDGCERLLDALGWQGVAMIEGKRDDDHGSWHVMEINGRFWGSLQLAIDSGVDFPALLVSAVLDREPVAAPSSTPGVRLRWEWGDIDHLLIRLRRSRTFLRLPAGAPSRLGAVLAFLSHSARRDRLEVFRLRDPMPFVVETLVRARVLR